MTRSLGNVAHRHAAALLNESEEKPCRTLGGDMVMGSAILPDRVLDLVADMAQQASQAVVRRERP